MSTRLIRHKTQWYISKELYSNVTNYFFTGDALGYHRDKPFSTKDEDNSRGRCAEKWHGAWWYDWCLNSNLNGHYDKNANDTDILWTSWTGLKPLKTVEMKIRPEHFKVGTNVCFLPCC